MPPVTPSPAFYVLSVKASRGLCCLVEAETRQGAIDAASELYDASRAFNGAGLLPSGVALLVVAAQDAPALISQKTVLASDRSKVLWQAGSY